jgi:hypothetical protein
MPVSIDWATKIITVPPDFMTLVSGTPGTGDNQLDPALYELDVNALRLTLKDIEDSDGMPFLDTHRHNGVVTISGVSYARTFEVINGYTVRFDVSTYDHYTVRCVGANHNISDVRQPNTVSLIIGNSAGLITTGGASPWTETIESGYTAAQILRILAAVAAGKTNIIDLGGGAATVEIRDLGDTKNRVVAGMTDSERSTVTLDGT